MARLYTANFNQVLDKNFQGWRTQMKKYCIKKIQAKVDDGPVLKKVTGRLWGWVKDLAQDHSDGFSIATKEHGRLWEQEGGWDRKAFDTVIRGRKVHVKAQHFDSRPFIKPTILEEQDYMAKELQISVEKAFKTCFPNKTVTVTVGTK